MQSHATLQPPYTVSVVMPLYNSSDFMEASIASVLRQSYRNLELILVDDRSTDDTLSMIYDLAQRDARVRVVALPVNGGAGAARNAGISAAVGRYVAFLDSDDLWEPNKLEIQIAEMNRLGAVFSYTDFFVVSGAQSSLMKSPDTMSYESLLKNTAIGCSTVVYDQSKLGPRHFPLLRKHEDLALWLEFLREVPLAFRCGGGLTHYAVRPGSVSSNKLKAAGYTWKVMTEIENIPIPKAVYYFLHYTFSATLKRVRRNFTRQ